MLTDIDERADATTAERIAAVLVMVDEVIEGCEEIDALCEELKASLQEVLP